MLQNASQNTVSRLPEASGHANTKTWQDTHADITMRRLNTIAVLDETLRYGIVPDIGLQTA